MRKFRIKESADVEGIDGHEVGGTYELYEIDADGDYWLKVDNKYVSWCYTPEELEEVFEDEEQKPTLHKDTDLGYFVAALLMAGHNIYEVVDGAKTIINQLNKEVKND